MVVNYFLAGSQQNTEWKLIRNKEILNFIWKLSLSTFLTFTYIKTIYKSQHYFFQSPRIALSIGKIFLANKISSFSFLKTTWIFVYKCFIKWKSEIDDVKWVITCIYQLQMIVHHQIMYFKFENEMKENWNESRKRTWNNKRKPFDKNMWVVK